MLSFKAFLLEYITDDQRDRYKDVKMTPEARGATDHFFGVGNDKVQGEILHDDKSEIHKQLENHLGQPVAHEDYNRGAIKDKYGRDVKIGRMIKDNSLRNQFDQDPARKLGTAPVLKTSTVRGVDVAGQTNPVPNAEHPTGHAWKDISCKNVENGVNAHYLDHEIKHGTVVHFVHDQNGQEIYRATIHPHHNSDGNVAYAVDAEYGIKHPKFTQDAHAIAEKLSGEYKPGLFTKQPMVYNDSGNRFVLHPKASHEEIDKSLHHELSKPYDEQNSRKLKMLLTHPNVSNDALSRALDTKESRADVWSLAAKHKNLTGEHLEKALTHERSDVVRAALQNPNTTADQLHHVLDTSGSHRTKRDVFLSPNANSSHIEKAIQHSVRDQDYDLLDRAIEHPSATPKQIDQISGMHRSLSRSALEHPNVTPWNIDRWLDSDEPSLKQGAARHPKASDQNITKALSGGMEKSPATFHAALENPNIKPHHVEGLLNHPDRTVRYNVLASKGLDANLIHKVLDTEKEPRMLRAVVRDSNKNINGSHIQKILTGDYDHTIKQRAAIHPNITPENINAAIDTKDDTVGFNALIHPHVTSDNLMHAVKSDSTAMESDALWHKKSKPEHWEYVARHSKSPGNVEVAKRFLRNGMRG